MNKEEECTCRLLNKCKIHPRREGFVMAVREYADRMRVKKKD